MASARRDGASRSPASARHPSPHCRVSRRARGVLRTGRRSRPRRRAGERRRWSPRARAAREPAGCLRLLVLLGVEGQVRSHVAAHCIGSVGCGRVSSDGCRTGANAESSAMARSKAESTSPAGRPAYGPKWSVASPSEEPRLRIVGVTVGGILETAVQPPEAGPPGAVRPDGEGTAREQRREQRIAQNRAGCPSAAARDCARQRRARRRSRASHTRFASSRAPQLEPSERGREAAVELDGTLIVRVRRVPVGPPEELLTLEERLERGQAGRAERRQLDGTDRARAAERLEHLQRQRVGRAVHPRRLVRRLPLVHRRASAGHIVQRRAEPHRVVARAEHRAVERQARSGPPAQEAADSGSARPCHLRMTVVGATVRSGPAPSRFRDRRSTNPSRQSARVGSSTSNGATATSDASSAAGRLRCASGAAPTPRQGGGTIRSTARTSTGAARAAASRRFGPRRRCAPSTARPERIVSRAVAAPPSASAMAPPRSEPVGRRPRERPSGDRVHGARDALADRGDRAGRLGQPPGDDRLRRRTGERRLARQHLVEHAAETVHVGARRRGRAPLWPARGSCRPASLPRCPSR